MKTNIVDALESNGRAGEKWIEPKSPLIMLLLFCVAFAVGGCETLESTHPGEPFDGRPAYVGGAGFAVGLSERWSHDGKPTNISVSGQNVTITNEHGQSSSG